MPKQWWLIMLYMAFVYCVLVGIIQYARHHPIIDDRQSSLENQALQEPP